MKKIGVLVHRLAVEYSSTVISGINSFFKDKNDISLLISQTRQPDFSEGSHEYQYWSGAELLKSECIDGLIVVSSSYLSSMHKEELQNLIKQFNTKYIVSIGLDLNQDNSYCTLCKPYDVYEEIVEYLKNERQCKKIAFFSANLVHTQEGEERFEAYKKALENNGYEYDPSIVLDGNFTMGVAKKVLNEHYKCKEDVSFDAIICANDIMASAVVQELSAIGVRIPIDVKVFGFDNTSHATMCNPPISTVDQQIYLQGSMASEMIYKLVNGEKVEKQVQVPLKIIYRESCGSQSFDFLLKNDTLNSHVNNFANITKVDVLLDSVTGVMTMEGFVHNYRNWSESTSFDCIAACIYDKPVLLNKKNDFNVPEKAKTVFYIDVKNDIEEYYENGIDINPQKLLFPDGILGPYNYLFQALFLGDVQYGYMLCRYNLLNFAINSISMQILTHSILQAHEYTQSIKNQEKLEKECAQLMHNNTSLQRESYTDELTKLYNRRGYLNYAQKLVSFSAEMGTTGLVFFADLDGLKTINDTHGHKYGDLAIQTIAEVLKKAFRQSDVIGRLSGDEFSIVAPGMNLVNVEPMKKKIQKFCEELSKEKELPFTVSISMGAVPFTSENYDVQSLLREADAKLYEEKKIKHAKR